MRYVILHQNIAFFSVAFTGWYYNLFKLYNEQLSEKAEKEAKSAQSHALPESVRMWTVNDVSKWMESLSLGKYVPAFREAAVDGPFLLELREEDLSQVLGITHKLHVRKILVSREKLKPLNKREQEMMEVVVQEVCNTYFNGHNNCLRDNPAPPL